MTKQYRILRSDGVLEICRSSIRSALSYMRIVRGTGCREAGVTYMLEVDLDGEWRPLRTL